jgi:gluconate 2-dehydrogenase gamma chain
MNFQNKFSRRSFFVLSAIGVSGIAILRCAPFTKSSQSSWRFLTEEESILLDSLAEQIIPSDEYLGGRDAGITNFIDKQLIGPYKRYQEAYRKGLTAIRETCKACFQKRFEELPWETQTEFLQKMQQGKMEGDMWKNGFDTEFFELIRKHSLQGFYGSPRHGGNKNYASYKMMKLDYPVIIGQNRYKS